MYNFILEIMLFASAGVIILLLTRAVPRVEDEGAEHHAPGIVDQVLRKIPLQKIDERLNSLFEKFLRRMKLFSMRFDNFINTRLSRLKKGNAVKEAGEARARLFEELNGENKE
jgi:hypothetical protein